MGKVIHIDIEGGGSGGSGIGWNGEVVNFAALPPAALHDLEQYNVLQATGSRFTLNRKKSGLYRSELGVWKKKNDAQLLLIDDQFSVYNAADNTKVLSFDNSGISTANNRVATWQDKDITVAGLDDISPFGNNYQFESDESESTNSTAVPQLKLTLTTPNLPLGDYKGQLYLEAGNSSTAGSVIIEFKLNTVLIGEMRFEPKDINDRMPISSFNVGQAISGIQVFEVLFYNEGTGTASVRKVRMDLQRVG